jgi:hypothetical protein
MSVFKWAIVTEGELTKKQEQALATMKKIMKACDGKSMNMKELKLATKLSASALSKHLRELIHQGVIEGKVVVSEASSEASCMRRKLLPMENVFMRNPNVALKMKGKKPQPVVETIQFHIPKGEPRRIWHGYTRKVKGGRKRFVPDFELIRRKPAKP